MIAAPSSAFADKVEFRTITPETSLDFPADPALEVSDIATIEFWVKPDWPVKPDFDPVILSAIGPEGPRYAVVMTQTADAIGLFSGEEWDYVDFDFTDGKPHHVAFVIQGDLTDVFIDGESFDALAQGIEDLPITSFHIGSLNGFDNPFWGDLGGIRLWDAAVEEESIAAYRETYIMSGEAFDHPDYGFLIGASDFQNGASEFILMDEDEDEIAQFERVADVPDETEYSPEFLAALEAEPDPELVAEPLDPAVEALFEDDADEFSDLDDIAARIEAGETVDIPELAFMEDEAEPTTDTMQGD
jgi:hypothetical protein